MRREDTHLRDYLRILRKRRFTVITVATLVLAAVVVATLTTRPLYRGEVKLLIEKAEQSNLTGGYRWYTSYDPEFYETQYQLIRSVSVAERVVKALALDAAQEFTAPAGAGRTGTLALVRSWGRRAWDWGRELLAGSVAARPTPDPEAAAAQAVADWPYQVAERVRSGIAVRPVQDSRVVEISFTSHNPETAAAVANAVANAYIEETLEIQLGGARRTLEWMTKKAEEEREKLEASERALQSYMRANDIVTLEDRLTVTPQKLSEISSHLVRAEARRKELEVQHKKVEELSRDPALLETLPSIAADRTLATLRTEILKAEQRLNELSRKYGPKHPVMIEATRDLEVLRGKRRQEVERIVSSLRNEYEMAVANERELHGLLEKTKRQVSGLNEKFIQYGILKREADANRQMYEALTKRLKEESVTEDTQTVTVWIVDAARPPKVPIKPRPARSLLLGLILALMSGVGLAFFVEYLDHSVRGPEDVEARLGIPVLGLVSRVRGRGKKAEQALQDGDLANVGEEFKSLRTALLLSSAEGPPRSLVVTSMTPEEGKTTTSLNLAVAVAESGRNVILVDADLRKPRLHRVLGLSNEAGLSTVLAGLSTGKDAVQEGPVPQLRVLPAGPVPPNPSELLSSTAMERLAEALTSQADLVIFDTPPVLSVADSRIVGRLAAGTLVVVRSKRVSYDALRQGLKSLDEVGAGVLGLVINGFEARKSGYGYYRHSNYYYGEAKP